MFRTISALVLSALLSISNGALAGAEIKSAADLPVSEWVKHAAFTEVSLSPDGKHIAMIVPKTDRSGLAIFAVDGMKPTLNMVQRQDEYIVDATWVSNERLILELGRRFDGNEAPGRTGELAAINFDGKRATYLFGYRGEQSVGSNIKTGRAEAAAAWLASDRLIDERYVMTLVRSFNVDPTRSPKWCRTDVYTGKTQCASGLPEKGQLAGWLAQDDELRVVTLEDVDGENRMYYRESGKADWKLIADQSKNGEAMWPAAWSGKGSEFYVYHNKNSGPTGLSKYDPADAKLTEVVAPKFASVGEVLLGMDRRTPSAVLLAGGRGSIKPLKPGPELELIRALGPLFPGEIAYPTQYSDDGKVALVILQSDVSPTHYYLYQFESKKLIDLGSARDNLNPDLMASTEVIDSKARDGLALESFLTLPVGANASSPAPLIVIPHGGPFNVRDDWYFDRETQLFASRGYAVLRVNFRGSGGYGHQFVTAGFKQWGRKMQTDLLDVAQVVTKRAEIDVKRVAIFGASYGGYAALMGGVQSPDFYKAVISLVGVTDLPLMYSRGDIEDTTYGIKFLERSLGRKDLEALSPVNNADKIKVPVMLIHGAKDERVPIVHAARMRAALKKAGNEPEWYVEQREGHGFYAPENNEAMYTKVLAFLDKHVKNAGAK